MSMESTLLQLMPGFTGPIGKETVVTLSNGKTITIVKEPEGGLWPWSVDGRLFSYDRWAEEYLKQVVYEKVTGLRVMMRPRYEVPHICGGNCAGYRNENGNDENDSPCGLCPIRDNAEAERDGVKLIYAVDVPNKREA